MWKSMEDGELSIVLQKTKKVKGFFKLSKIIFQREEAPYLDRESTSPINWNILCL